MHVCWRKRIEGGWGREGEKEKMRKDEKKKERQGDAAVCFWVPVSFLGILFSPMGEFKQTQPS